MDRTFQPSRKYPKRPAKGGLVDGFAEESTIFGGYNQFPSSEQGGGILRLLDNFTLYVQTDDEGSEELVDLQDFAADGVNGLPLKATGTVLDHRLCSQQSVYDARASSRIKVRIHYIRDWVVDYSQVVTVWLITDWAWYRLLSPSRIYQQLYSSTAHKTELVHACLQLLSTSPNITQDVMARRLTEGVTVVRHPIDEEAELAGFEDVSHAEVQQYGQHDLADHAAFVVQQIAPLLGRHALKSFLVPLAERAGIQLSTLIGSGGKLISAASEAAAADVRRRPAPQTSFLVPQAAVPSLLLVWDFCQRYGALLRLPPFPFLRLQLACVNEPPTQFTPTASLLATNHSNVGTPERHTIFCKQCDSTFSSSKALREHCSLSGHDPGKNPRSPKQKQSPAPVQCAVPLTLTVQPEPDQVEMDRWGPTGQGKLLCDIHSALIRVLEGLDEDLMEAPTMAGYGSATDLAPQDAYRPLLGASWPELTCRYLQDHTSLIISQDAVEAVVRLKATEYDTLSVRDRALVLEALATVAANTELLRKHLHHLEPEGSPPLLNRGAVVGQDVAGNIYHQLGDASARGALYVEGLEGREWGWYSPQQIPSLVAWLETGSAQEQQLAEDLFSMYRPVLKIGMPPGQVASEGVIQQDLWQPMPSPRQLQVTPEALQHPRDGYKGSQPVIHPSKPLQQELLRLLATAPFWNKDLEWLQSRAAVQALLPKAVTGPQFARLLWLIEDLLYEDLLRGSGWGRRRGWFRDQLEATCNIAQAAALGGQLAAHCRREGDLGLVTPQELLQSAQRQRCYLGYIPQPPQDVVLFKSGYEAHIRQQERTVPAIPAWLDSWAPMQDCKVKQMACVVEHLPASQRQAAMRSQATLPGVPPRPPEPPCTAWLLLERDSAIPTQAAVPGEDDEIDWTHFTFQHGFRQLPQHLPHQLPQRLPSAPSLATNGLASTDAEMSEAGHSPSLADLPTQHFNAKPESDMKPATGIKPDSDIKSEPGIKQESGAASNFQSAGQAAFKQEAPQHAQHGLAAGPSSDGQAGATEEEEGAEQGDIEETVAMEEGDAEEQGSDDESVEGQRLTRSRRSNAAGLYMLDHGSQLVPKKIRQALQRPTQRPARLLNNALDDSNLLTLTEGEGVPTLPLPVPHMLPGEDRVRFWRKERSLLAVALHVKAGMTRAAEFLVPVQLCNRALSVPWPAGMPVKMPFTGTVLDHLTKPRPDTRFCTGVLRQSLPAVRPTTGVASPSPNTSPAAVAPAAVSTATTAGIAASQAPSTAAATAAANDPAKAVPGAVVASAGALPGGITASGGAVPQPGSAVGLLGSASAVQNTTTSPAAAAYAGDPSLAPQQNGTQQQQQPPSVGVTAGLQAGLNPASSAAVLTQDPSNLTSAAAQPQPATSAAGTAAAATQPGPNAPAVQTEAAGTTTPSSLYQQAAATPANANGSATDSQAAVNTAVTAAINTTFSQQTGQTPAAEAAAASAVPPQLAGQGMADVAAQSVDPWNALDVAWDSDTPPGWPKLVCPWQVMEDRGGELRKAKERYRQAEAEKREKAKQEALIRDANRRAAAERSQQAAAAMNAERMRRALEARAVVAQVAEQKEAGRAAMAAQGTNGAQLLAGVIPQPNTALGMTGLGRPVVPGTAGTAALPYAQTLSQLQGIPLAQQHQQAQLASQAKANLPAGALQPVHQSTLPMQYQPSFDYTQAYRQSQLGTHGQTAADPTHGNALLQVQAALGAKPHVQLPVTQPEAAQGATQPQGLSQAAAGQQQAIGGLAMGVANPSGEGESPEGTQGSSPGQTEGSGVKRGRSAEGDEQSSPPRAKKAKPAAEGYRERWLAGKPRAQSKTWCSMLCSVCEQGGNEAELLVCKGPCLRAFHPACLSLTPASAPSPATQANWFCPECVHGRVRCFVCGEFGAGFEDPTVRKCSLGVCGRFYHIKCAQSLELSQMAKKGAHFRCPQHYCAVCRKSGDGVDMVKCIRCPTAYHSSCMPKDIQRLLPHAKVVLCGKHNGEAAPPYYPPPAPDPTKLEAAQQQGRAMGLPPIKAKASHGAVSGIALPSPEQSQAGQDDDLQELHGGQLADDTTQATGLADAAALGNADAMSVHPTHAASYTAMLAEPLADEDLPHTTAQPAQQQEQQHHQHQQQTQPEPGSSPFPAQC